MRYKCMYEGPRITLRWLLNYQRYKLQLCLDRYISLTDGAVHGIQLEPIGVCKIVQDFIFDCSNDRKNTPRAQISVTLSLRSVTRYSWKKMAAMGLSSVGGYPSKTHLKLKTCKISLVHNIPFIFHMFLIFCTDHVSITVVQCTTFQNNWVNMK